MRSIGSFEGVDVSLELRDGHQIIILSVPAALAGTGSSYAALGLANTIAFSAQKSIDDAAGGYRIEITHSARVDQRIRALVDLLITARYEHPTMVQMRLELNEAEAERLEAALS